MCSAPSLRRFQVILSTLGTALCCAAAFAQQERFRIDSDTRDEQIGEAVEWLDDINGDGVRDFAFRSRNLSSYYLDDPQNPHEDERIEIVSGLDFSILRTLHWSHGTAFGIAIACGGDHDADGVRELLVLRLVEGGSEGVISAISPATGTRLRDYPITGALDCSFAALDTIDDSDGDGLVEMVVGIPQDDHADGTWGSIRVVASSDGRTLAEWRGSQGHFDDDQNFGRDATFSAVPDADLDGREDLVVCEFITEGDGDHRFDVRLYSGATLLELARSSVTKSKHFYLGAISGTADLNADGRGDVVLVINNAAAGVYNSLLELSGSNLSTIRSANPDFAWIYRCASMGDANGDGRGDYALTGIDWDGPDEYVLLVLAGKTGALLTEVRNPVPSGEFDPVSACLPRSAPADLDGDTRPELLYGEPRGYPDARKVAALSTASDLDVGSIGADMATWIVKELQFTSDLDADGIGDFLARVQAKDSGGFRQLLSVRSGLDGAELREFNLSSDALPTDEFTRICAIPDADGDGVADYVVGSTLALGLQLTLRSGRDDRLIRSILASPDYEDSTIDLRSFIEPDQVTAKLVLLSPSRFEGSPNGDEGRVTVFDLATATVLWSDRGRDFNEYFGNGCAVLDDLDGDGQREIAIGAPGRRYATGPRRTGVVEVRSGADGTILGSIEAPADAFDFGRHLAAVADVDGDRLLDFVVAAGYWRYYEPGTLSAYSAASLTMLWQQASSTTTGSLSDRLVRLEDGNGDRVDELLCGPLPPKRLAAVASSNGRVLGRAISQTVAQGGSPIALATAPDWLACDAFGSPARSLAMTNGPRKGAAVLSFPELWLTLEPESAAVDTTVVADVRGGAPLAFMGILITAFDGVPFERFGVLDFFDTMGEWSDQQATPAGLEGMTLSLQAFAVGFDGRLAISSIRELRFE